jgi:hypothetical protein
MTIRWRELNGNTTIPCSFPQLYGNRWRTTQSGRAGAARQGPRKLLGEGSKNRDARAGTIAAPGFVRANVGMCYEICLCVDICRRAARRNASAAARKTGPGIAARAVPRPDPPNRRVHLPNRQAHLSRHARDLPHRTPPPSRVWRTGPWSRSTPRPAKTAQPPPVIRASIAQGKPWKYGSAAAYRTVRAGRPARTGLDRLTPTGLLLLATGIF